MSSPEGLQNPRAGTAKKNLDYLLEYVGQFIKRNKHENRFNGVLQNVWNIMAQTKLRWFNFRYRYTNCLSTRHESLFGVSFLYDLAMLLPCFQKIN